jgi:hypothetical protein
VILFSVNHFCSALAAAKQRKGLNEKSTFFVFLINRFEASVLLLRASLMTTMFFSCPLNTLIPLTNNQRLVTAYPRWKICRYRNGIWIVGRDKHHAFLGIAKKNYTVILLPTKCCCGTYNLLRFNQQNYFQKSFTVSTFLGQISKIILSLKTTYFWAYL